MFIFLTVILFFVGIIFGAAGLWEPNKKKLFTGAVFLWLAVMIFHFFVVPVDEALQTLTITG